MQEVDHLVIGAGLAGLVLARFLGEAHERVALLDPSPAGYKIGESLIPELFRHPELRALFPALESLPSYAPKHGTTFIADGDVVYFPLASSEAGLSMHVARPEMERAMIDAWGLEVTRARVTSIDFDAHVVETTAGRFKVRGPILDCSGPAMLVARLRDELETLAPVHATWGYHDILAVDDERCASDYRARGWQLRQYDPRNRQLLTAAQATPWRASLTTQLTRLDDGLWTWQIPLHDGARLSFGVVSRHGPITPTRYRELARDHVSPCFSLAQPERNDDDDDDDAGARASDPFRRLHQRDGFARRARRAADRDYILLADAFAFSDPVYSVGAGFAVNQAIRVAELLNARPWNREDCERYREWSEALLRRATAAFNFWYSGEVFRDDAVAAEVQEDFLSGNLFQKTISSAYGAVLENSELHGADDPFAARWADAPVDDDVAALLELDGAALDGWRLARAQPCAAGLQLRWRHDDRPELTMLVEADPDGAKSRYVGAGPLALSYMRGIDGERPQLATIDGLFREFAARAGERGDDWLALLERVRAPG